MADLTAIILTKNEEKNIRKCIKSIKSVVKRIIIVDSFSDDDTIIIAKKLGAEIVQNEFVNNAVQFNWALENVCINTKWILKIDADEELTPELSKEINRKLDKISDGINGVILRRRVYFMGRWLKHGGKYPEMLLRIFRTGHGMSENKMMDEHLMVMDGKTLSFKNDFIDNNKKPLELWIQKHDKYSYREACEVLTNNKDINNNKEQHWQVKLKRIIKKHGYYNLPMFFRAHLYYIYRYYFRLGFLDGVEGKIYTFLQAYWYRFLVDAKIYELKNDKR